MSDIERPIYARDAEFRLQCPRCRRDLAAGFISVSVSQIRGDGRYWCKTPGCGYRYDMNGDEAYWLKESA